MERDLKRELLEHAGYIFLPNGEWWDPDQRLLSSWDGDVWSFPGDMLVNPIFELWFCVFMHSVTARGDCVHSPKGWANLIIAHVTYLAKGEFFDWDEVFIDRESPDSTARVRIIDCLGADPERTMVRLRGKLNKPPMCQGWESLLPRYCVYALAWKVYMARAHRPEFCARLLP